VNATGLPSLRITGDRSTPGLDMTIPAARIRLILAIVLLIFGSTRLPQLGKGLGQSIRNFRQGLRGGDDGESSDSDRPPRS